MTFAGVILAAGLSSRMGRSKPLLTYLGETFLDRMIAVLSPSCKPVIAVLGHEAQAVREQLRRKDEVTFVENPHYLLGQLSSLQCGLRALDAGVTHAVFTPVDLPLLRAETVSAVVDAAQQNPDRIVMPRFQGKRGHPAILPRRMFEGMLALSPDGKPNEFIRPRLHEAVFADVDDEGIMRDVDLPSEYASLTGERIV